MHRLGAKVPHFCEWVCNAPQTSKFIVVARGTLGKHVKISADVVWDLLQEARESHKSIGEILSVRRKACNCSCRSDSVACTANGNALSSICVEVYYTLG
jgi:hypothetical protein